MTLNAVRAICEEVALETRVTRITTGEFGAGPCLGYSVLRSEKRAAELSHRYGGLRECLARLD